MSLIQRIGRQSRITFASQGSVPEIATSPNLEPLVTLVNELKASDLNLPSTPEAADLAPPEGAPAAFIPVARGQFYSIAAFLLRKGVAMPIHDHPGMRGICKVLYGRVRITSFSPTRRIEPKPSDRRTYGYYAVDDQGTEELTSDSPCAVLTPDKKNVHTIFALEHAAFFDILGPPYSPEDGRNCNYYEEVPKETVFGSEEVNQLDGVRVLKRTGQPMWFYTALKPYRGPPVDEKDV